MQKINFLLTLFILTLGDNLFGQSYTGFRPLTSQEYAVVPQAPAFNGAGYSFPASYDLSSYMPPPGQQGQQGSCTSWAVAYATKSYQEAKEEGWSYYFNNGQVNYNHLFSPAFIHNQLTANTYKNGLSFPEALNFVKNNGCASLAEMSYDENDNRTQPTSTIKARATKYKIKGYYRLGTQGSISVEDVKYRLTQGYPVMFACYVDEGFNNNCSYPNIWYGYWGRNLGYSHAMVVVGYDDSYGAFKVLNSYGSYWGHNGYCWINYNHFKNITLEAYIAYDDKNSNFQEENNDIVWNDKKITWTDTKPIIKTNPTPPQPIYDSYDFFVTPNPVNDKKEYEYTGNIMGSYDVTKNTRLTGNIMGPLTISNGAHLTMTGNVMGSVTLSGGATLTLIGNVTGDLTVNANSKATVTGCVTGRNISYGGSSSINCNSSGGSSSSTTIVIIR